MSDSIATSRQHREAVATSRDESLRLLYVGITRAREELALAVRNKKAGVAASWVSELTDDAGDTVIEWPAVGRKDMPRDPTGGAVHPLVAGGEIFDALVRFLSPGEEAAPGRESRAEAPRYIQGTAHPSRRPRTAVV